MHGFIKSVSPQGSTTVSKFDLLFGLRFLQSRKDILEQSIASTYKMTVHLTQL